jgi:YHS domain-containing protein
MAKILMAYNFRLRNTEEYSELIEKFDKNGYSIKIMPEISKENVEIEKLEIDIDNIRKEQSSIEEIIVISNIKDLLFCWYRVYNHLVDKFIFFIDKINQNILTRNKDFEVYEKIADLRTVKKIEEITPIFLNLNYTNCLNVKNFLLDSRIMKNIESVDSVCKTKLTKRNFACNFLLGGEKYYFGNSKDKNIEVELEKEEEEVISETIIDIIERKYSIFQYFIYCLIKSLTTEEAREILIPIFKKMNSKSIAEKNSIVEKIVNKGSFESIDFVEKIKILSLIIVLDIDNPDISSNRIFNEIIVDNGKNGKYYYYIFINLILAKLSIDEKKYYNLFSEVLKLETDYYKKVLDIGNENTANIKNNKRIVILVDSLRIGNYSGTKFAFDIAVNIKKTKPNYEIAIFCEDNFFGNQLENIMIFDYNKGKVESSAQYYKEHSELKKEYIIKIEYSDIRKIKSERIKDTVNFMKDYAPEVIISTCIMSDSINILYETYPVIYLSLGGVNPMNLSDLELYPHLDGIIEFMKSYNIHLDRKKIKEFDYGGGFEPSKESYSRNDFYLDEDDFIIVTVGLWLKQELTEEYLEMVIAFIRKDKRIKWFIIGEIDIPYLDNKYKDLIDKQIFKIKFIEKLGSFFKICDLYINPLRIGGGFSMAEAIANDTAVISLIASPAGKLHCGENECVTNLKDYFIEMLRCFEDKNYLEKKLNKEKIVQHNLSYEVKIPILIEYIKSAKKIFLERKKDEQKSFVNSKF